MNNYIGSIIQWESLPMRLDEYKEALEYYKLASQYLNKNKTRQYKLCVLG